MEDSFLKSVQCCLKSDYSHVVKMPFVLKCGAVCCQECFRLNEDIKAKRRFFCFKCNDNHEHNPNEPTAINELFEYAVRANLTCLFDHIDKTFVNHVKTFQDLGLQDKLKENVSQVRNKLKSHFESKKQELADGYTILSNELDKLEETNKMASTTSLDQYLQINRTDANSTRSLDTFYKYQELLMKTFETLTSNKENVVTVNFFPNEAVKFNECIIGRIRRETQMQEQTAKRHVADSSETQRNNIDILASSQQLAQAMTNIAPELSFHEPSRPFEGRHTSEILNKILLTDICQKAISAETSINCKRLSDCLPDRMTAPHKNLIYFPDSERSLINTFNIQTNEVRSYCPFEQISKPHSLSLDKIRNRLFVGATHKSNGECVSVLDLNENFKTIKVFGYELCKNHDNPDFKQASTMIKHLDCLEYDHSSDHLYITEKWNDRVSKWDVSTGSIKNEIKLVYPSFIRIANDYLFIISYSFGKFNQLSGETPNGQQKIDEYELTSVLQGDNCIYIINKTTLTEIRRIKLDDWLTPRGLYVDQNLNICTIAMNLDTKKVITRESLYCFDFNGKLLNRIPTKYNDLYIMDFQLFEVNNEIKILIAMQDLYKKKIDIYSFQLPKKTR